MKKIHFFDLFQKALKNHYFYKKRPKGKNFKKKRQSCKPVKNYISEALILLQVRRTRLCFELVGRLMAGTPESTAGEKESPSHPEPHGVEQSTFFRASRKKGCCGDVGRTRFRRGELRAPRWTEVSNLAYEGRTHNHIRIMKYVYDL